ncbi:Uncharacterised protein [BD1-7 clade bacterium]|uniref:Prepilin type IV endopeptidase peptidase domain-containing protein n=1 Tax=BD1-7 clade bacterium TaxID=2029982 RepID=A0A5S9Q9J7_9GAMM|nr:Uncharacterised protein [BD1-7 clade bacterium]CAA0114056.1 Uncharacterised protein [BD1-7 clade bacterium]
MASYLLQIAIVAVAINTAITDYKHRKITNTTIVIVFFVALISFFSGQSEWHSAVLLLPALAVYCLLYTFKIFGAGDLKYFFVMALYFGEEQFFNFLISVLLLGGVWAIVYTVIERYSQVQQALPGMPYGVAISAATLLGMLLMPGSLLLSTLLRVI